VLAGTTAVPVTADVAATSAFTVVGTGTGNADSHFSINLNSYLRGNGRNFNVVQASALKIQRPSGAATTFVTVPVQIRTPAGDENVNGSVLRVVYGTRVANLSNTAAGNSASVSFRIHYNSPIHTENANLSPIVTFNFNIFVPTTAGTPVVADANAVIRVP